MMHQDPNAPAAVAAPSQDLRAERRELSSQLQELESSRRGLVSQLQKAPTASDERRLLTGQLSDVNQRIATVDKMLARTQAQIAGSPGSAITVVPRQPIFIERNRQYEGVLWGSIMAFVLLLPFTITLARRMWRRTPPANAPIPAALDDRLARIEHIIEATAIEVERIGEGQRFVTRLLTESEPARVLATSASQAAPSSPAGT
jgi:uncharacterized protein YukE